MITREIAEDIVREVRLSARPGGADYISPLTAGPSTDGGDDEYTPPPGNPMAVARHILPEWMYGGHRTLRHWHGSWMVWEHTHWREADEREIRKWVYHRLEHATFVFVNPKGDGGEKPWAPSKKKIADLLDAVAAVTHLPPSAVTPSWVDGYQRARLGDDSPVVACTNGLLRVADRELLPLTPKFFNLVSVPFDYDPDAPEPKRWLEFLGQLWPGDQESIDVLQEFFGYVLSGRTDLHKILLIVGPTRSGKGTIARILGALVGRGNVAGPTLASLGTNFGLSPLLGKSLAVISDARLGGPDRHRVVERLLTVSGEDNIDVDRKYRNPWTGQLPTRFMILSNELPNFGDASGTIAHRFVVLVMHISFLGRENPGLTGELSAELPGILNWALDGLARLTKNGRFTALTSSADAVVTMQDMASPVSAFVREKCKVGLGLSIPVDSLWSAWKIWCENDNHRLGNKSIFSRDLAAVSPGVRVYRPHGEPRRYAGITLAAGGTHNDGTGGSAGSAGTGEPAEPAEPPGSPLWRQHELPPPDTLVPAEQDDLADVPGPDRPPATDVPPCVRCARPGSASYALTPKRHGPSLCHECWETAAFHRHGGNRERRGNPTTPPEGTVTP